MRVGCDGYVSYRALELDFWADSKFAFFMSIAQRKPQSGSKLLLSMLFGFSFVRSVIL